MESRRGWFKSSRSNGQGDDCVEVRFGDGRVDVRDSKNPDLPYISISVSLWTEFLTYVKDSSN
jgi:hypothetical protein